MFKSLINKRFLFNKELISYSCLVDLLRTYGFNTTHIQEPIVQDFDVYGLYIKPGFELAYISKYQEYPNSSNYLVYESMLCTEIDFSEVLHALNYTITTDSNAINKLNKSEFITLTDKNLEEYTFRKNKIDMLVYRKERLEVLYLNAVYYFVMSKEKYEEIKKEIEWP